VRDQVPHLYKFTGKITLLDILVLIFLDSKWDGPNGTKHSPSSISS
jgi:hypothetical protein